MKNVLKKVLCLTLVLVFVMSSSVFAVNVEETEREETIIIRSEVSAEEIEAGFDRQIQAIIGKNMMTRGYGDIYETEIVHKKTVKLDGYLEGNSPGGTRFPSGGGFLYSKDHGTQVSISVQMPAPFSMVYVGTNLGKVGSSGIFCPVPNNTDYFKLWGEKEYIVKAYKVWEIDRVTGERTLYYKGTLSEFWRDSYWPKSQ